MIMGNVLYLRVDTESIADYKELGAEPFKYKTRRGEVFVRNYYAVQEYVMEDSAMLVTWANRAQQAARTSKKPSSKPDR